jgi:hypothetical protein
MNERGFYKEVGRERLEGGVLTLRFGTTAAAKNLPPVNHSFSFNIEDQNMKTSDLKGTVSRDGVSTETIGV